jgi:hypothetical protein
MGLAEIKKSSEEVTDSEETQLMLTADGKLVEVPVSVLKQTKPKLDVRLPKNLWNWLESKK